MPPTKTIIDCSDITSYGCKVDDVDWLFKLKYNPLLSHCSSGRKVADSEHPCRYRLKAMKSMCSSNCPSGFKSSDKKVSFSFILIDGRIVEVDTFDFRFSKLKQLARSCDFIVTKIERILLICHHNKDFGMPAEWHFFATSHGKGPCDGVGGTVKRLAARASLQRPINNQITTPRQLFEFAESEIKSIDIDRDARSPRLFFRCYNKTGEDCTSTWRASQRHQLCTHNWLCHCSLWWFLVGDMCCWNFPRIRRNWSKFFASDLHDRSDIRLQKMY